MRSRDSPWHLYWSMYFFRMAVVLCILSHVAEPSPRMVISPALADMQPLNDLHDFHRLPNAHNPKNKNSKNDNSNTNNLILPLGGIGNVQDPPGGPFAQFMDPSAGRGAGATRGAGLKEIEDASAAPAAAVASKPKKRIHKKRFHDNHVGPVIQRKPGHKFIPTGLALLTTVDGHLYCINKGNGQVLWKRPPMAEGAIVSSNATRFSWPGGQTPDLQEEQEFESEDWTFIVEPSEVPTLYVFSRSSGLQPVGSLVQLVINSPQIRPDGKRITGSKSTSLLELYISSGEIANVFEKPNGCTGTEGIKGSELTIVLGHAQYNLCITDPVSGMQWEISYSEYFPQSEYRPQETTGPLTWIGSDKDGVVALYNDAIGSYMWTNHEPLSPTTAVFEIYRNTLTPGVVISRQRHVPAPFRDSSTAHVGRYNDQLYVLSKKYFPLLKYELAGVYQRRPHLGIEGPAPKKDDFDADSTSFCRAGSPYFPDCILGSHPIGFQFRPDGFLMLDGLVEGSESEAEQEDPVPPAVKPLQKNSTPPPSLDDKPYEPFGPPPPVSTTTTVVGWLVILVGVLAAVIYNKGTSYLTTPVDQFLADHGIGFRVDHLAKSVTEGAAAVSTAVLTASSALGVGSRDAKDQLPNFYESAERALSSSRVDQPSNGQNESSSLLEKGPSSFVDSDVKSEKSKKGPRIKSPDSSQSDGKPVNGGGGINEKVGGGRKKKRGAGGKGQKAAAAAAAAAAEAASMGQADGAGVGSPAVQNSTKLAHDSKDVAASATADSQDGETSTSEKDQVVVPSTPIPTALGSTMLKSISVTDTILGYGSHGTVVYKGTFDRRSVAVKRLLIDFYDVAFHEVRLLQESDDHPNVVRYFRSEQCDRFLYIALELCSASLDDIIERGHVQPYRDLSATLEPQKILYQIISGIHHLHSLKIVHRDIKPQNILIGEPKQRPKPSRSAQSSPASLSTSTLLGSPTKAPVLGSGGMITGVVRAASSPAVDLYPGRVLISDFGLCRKLENDQSSFHNTTAHGGRGGGGGGTIGWRAPECFSGGDKDEDLMAMQVMINGGVDASSSGSSSQNESNTPGDSSGRGANRMTRAIDIFSAGCVFYYVLTNGDHPFGDRYSRERNILLDQPNLEGLGSMGQEGVEAKDLISKMISHDPNERPDAFTVMHHPYFWSANKRLMFMQDCSDRFEVEDRGEAGDAQGQSPLLLKLERDAKEILVKDWYKVIDRTLVENLGKYRKYDGHSVRDLLRALRNKKHHYQDLPPHVKRALGELPHGFLNYFTTRFPKLMLHLYYIVAEDPMLRNESMFRHYFVD